MPPASQPDRQAQVTRFLELSPAVQARMRASVPEELRAGFDSLTPRQLHALALLPDEGLGMSQLAAALGVTAATASTLAGRLVAQELAVRLAGAGDRRVVMLAPSDRGRDMAGRYWQAQRRAAAALFARLTEEQARSLLGVLEVLAADIPGEARTAPFPDWPG
jgi:DNA-binding MarR family transcriptional regulator